MSNRLDPITRSAYTELTATERTAFWGAVWAAGKAKGRMNAQKGGSKIDWAPYSLNPGTGCELDCKYCYAREMARDSFEITFHPLRLTIPLWQKPTDPTVNRIFYGSMTEIGLWHSDWCEAAAVVMSHATDWQFLLLTKLPQVYGREESSFAATKLPWFYGREESSFVAPPNRWLGVTVDTVGRLENAVKVYTRIQSEQIKWLSLEPLQDAALVAALTVDHLALFDWVVIGGRSPTRQVEAFTPPVAWVNHIYGLAKRAGCQVYCKHNLGPAFLNEQQIPRSRMANLPQMRMQAELF